MTPPVLGVVALPQLPLERLRSVALAADDAELEELWLWEDCFHSGGTATATAVLAWTERLRVGVGLLPVPLRNPALVAMETATLSHLFPGRYQLALGHGVQEWMGQVGARVESPLTLLREHLTAVRALLDGRTVSTSGRYVSLDHVVLDRPPRPAPAVHAGASGPRSLALCGELAEGTVLTGGTTPDGVSGARRHVARGRAAAGRRDPHTVTVYLMAATGPGAEDRLTAEQRRVDVGVGADTGVAGDADAVAAAVLRWADAGADTVVLQPTADEPDPEGFTRWAGEEVRPRLRG